MNFYRDRQVRNYLLFLVGFVLLIFLTGIWIHHLQITIAKKNFLEYSSSVAAVLLDEHVPEDVIAKALTDVSVNQTGEKFLGKIGMTEHTAVRFIPFLTELQQKTAVLMLLAGALLTIILLIGTCRYFKKRDQLFLESAQVISRFTEGDFSRHLPQTGEGTVFQFFASVDQLAAILQSKNDSRQKTGEFLKNTISDISHQLKTPLAALSIYHEIIADEADHPETVTEYSEKARLALERMELLIRSLLKITRLDAGSIRFEKRDCPVTDLLSTSVRELITRAEKENKKMFFEGISQETIYCDPEWTGEAIANLVKNALDHTREGDEIHITWERRPGVSRIVIADNGPGIAPEDIYHIFKRFYRSKNSLNRPGTGLGLPLAKSIIEGQGGVLSVESALQEGSSFIISFLTEL